MEEDNGVVFFLAFQHFHIVVKISFRERREEAEKNYNFYFILFIVLMVAFIMLESPSIPVSTRMVLEVCHLLSSMVMRQNQP
jgi:hypothetical protein